MGEVLYLLNVGLRDLLHYSVADEIHKTIPTATHTYLKVENKCRSRSG
jgi:hypothetical protein